MTLPLYSPWIGSILGTHTNDESLSLQNNWSFTDQLFWFIYCSFLHTKMLLIPDLLPIDVRMTPIWK